MRKENVKRQLRETKETRAKGRGVQAITYCRREAEERKHREMRTGEDRHICWKVQERQRGRKLGKGWH